MEGNSKQNPNTTNGQEIEQLNSFIPFMRFKVVNNPFTVIHYGQHFSHSFRARRHKRDRVIKNVFFSFILYANCIKFSYGELEQASILFSKKTITFDPFEMCCIIFPSFFQCTPVEEKTRWNQFTSKNNDMTFCFEFVATFRMPLVGQYRLICLFMFLLTPATKWWSDGRLGCLSSGWVRMK